MGNEQGGKFSVVDDEDDKGEKIKIKIINPAFMKSLHDLDFIDDGDEISNPLARPSEEQKKRKFIRKIVTYEGNLGDTLDKEIIIRPCVIKDESDLLKQNLSKIQLKEPLPKDATKNDLIRIGQEIISLLRDPMLVGEMLQELEKSITADMDKKGISFSDSDLPESFISSYSGYLIPGSRPQGYEKRNKDRMIDRILLEREMGAGVNTEGFSPKFVGLIDPVSANTFVASGHLFGDDAQVDTHITHGKFSHRLQHEVIRQAIKKDLISLKLENGQELNYKELLAVMVATEPNLWNITMDSGVDNTRKSPSEMVEPANHNFSCTSPSNINSLIMCCGSHVGLPNLQHVMLDSHWKEVDKFVERVRNLDANRIPEKSAGEIYIACMSLLGQQMRDGFVEQSFFTLSPKLSLEAGLESKKYEEFSAGSDGIVQKSPRVQSAKKMVSSIPPLSLGT